MVHFYLFPQVCVSFNPQSTLIATGSMDTTCRLWDVEKGVEVANLEVSPPPPPPHVVLNVVLAVKMRY